MRSTLTLLALVVLFLYAPAVFAQSDVRPDGAIIQQAPCAANEIGTYDQYLQSSTRAFVDEIELEVLLADRGIHAHRRVHQPEADAAAPHRSWSRRRHVTYTIGENRVLATRPDSCSAGTRMIERCRALL